MNGKPEFFKISYLLILIIIFSALPVFFITSRPEKQLCVSRNYPVMGTFAEVKLYGNDKQTLELAADTVQQKLSEVEQTCNIFDPESELSRLNKCAFEKPFKCSELLWDVLMISKRFYELSNGDFDITAKPLMDLWGFYRKRGGELPSEGEVKTVLKHVGLNKVVFDMKNKTVRFNVKGLSFDLGGVAKGFAVDNAVAAVKKLKINAGIINLGGNMYCFPVAPEGKKNYIVGIRNPINKDTICGKLGLLDKSVATSGNYERYVTINGKHYTHIMNVKTGQPIQNMLSVTVITKHAVEADILSTAVFIKGAEFAGNICKEIPRTQILIIKYDADKKFEIKKIGSCWGKINL